MTTRLDIVLDRFVRVGGAKAIDLADGSQVRLKTVVPRDDRQQRRRAQLAALRSAVRIAGLAPLVDYGVSGRGEWIEAYRFDPQDIHAGCACEPPLPHAAIAALLAQAGCAPPTTRDAGGSETAAAGRYRAVGTIIVRRDELDAVTELLAAPSGAGARSVRVDAPAGAGARTFFEAIAREARLGGFVPLSSVFCGEARAPVPGLDCTTLAAAMHERHVAILDAPGARAPECPRADVARFLSRLDTAGGRQHAVIGCGRASACEAAIALGPMRDDQLRRSLLCTGIDAARLEAAIERALRLSEGWPAAFAVHVRRQLGLPGPERPYRFSRFGAAAVREAGPPTRGSLEASKDGGHAPAVLLRAAQLAGRGRHAAAERLLRRATGYFSRRSRAGDVANVQLALGRLLLDRGRWRAAREAFGESRRLFDERRDAVGVVLALLHLGTSYIEEGALPAAESVLRTAEVGAGHARLGELRRAAGLLLARCLFWQGRHDEAWRLVELDDPQSGDPIIAAGAVAEGREASGGGLAWGASQTEYPGPPGLSTVAAEIGVRTALARRDAGLAARRLAAAGEARAEQGPLHAATLLALRLLVQSALGEGQAVARTASSGLTLMRRLHAPLAAREVRLAHLEALVDARARPQAAACLRRLGGTSSRAFAGLARLRLEALAARLRALDAEGPRREDGTNGTIDASAVVRMLQHCHDAKSEADAIGGVCQTVRAALGASSVSAFALVNGAPQLAASAGQRPCRPELAERSAAALLVVGPEHSSSGREMAAPVRYGGAAVGAIALRWAAGTQGADESRAPGIMAAAAAAIGPALAALSAEGPARDGAAARLGDLGGPSAAMDEVRRQVARAATAPYPVLILGESGTGKELIAKAIHAGSARRSRRFCAVNCAALSDDLFETELFGHARGSFTGAASDRAGLFEEADGGTLFLDEVGELSPRAQAKLLRAIQEGEIRRVGENHPRRVDARIVAATNRPLGDEVKAGRFRHDLLYRLDVVRITVPPLRERPEDVPPLAREFWREAMHRTGGQAELSPATLAALARYDWPGNVRELQNTLAALAVHAPPRGRVGPARLPAAIVGAGQPGAGEAITLAEARRRFEERFVRATLARAGGHRSEAASALGLSRQGLAKLITRLGIGAEARPY